MNDNAVRGTLKVIVGILDQLDLDDFFGTEGWKNFMGLED